jgi:NAD(P)-dependent dehydrogenase (short-subunit alcohol dehydrogenase family)
MALDLRSRGISVGLINPGLVDTRGLLDLPPEDPGPPDLAHLVRLVRAGAVPLIRPDVSVSGMIGLIEDLGPERSGEFRNYDGTPLPW